MSGSGATSFALFGDRTAAEEARTALAAAEPRWWCAAVRQRILIPPLPGSTNLSQPGYDHGYPLDGFPVGFGTGRAPRFGGFRDGLPDRRADQARQRLAQQTDRRTHALGLGCRTLIGAVKPFRGGLGSSLTVYLLFSDVRRNLGDFGRDIRRRAEEDPLVDPEKEGYQACP